MDRTLEVEFLGRSWTVGPGQSLEFGRDAEIDIDENPYLHRRLGRFEHRNGMWFLSNIGRSLHISVLDGTTQSQATIAPGRELALTFSPALMRFRAGKANYELRLSTEVDRIPDCDRAVTADTITHTTIPLTPDQRRLVLALAEPALRDPGGVLRIPPTKQAAQRLGWSVTRFNRKLDSVCAKLEKSGVSDLHGRAGNLATNRRAVLVQFAIQSGLATAADLVLLDRRVEAARNDENLIDEGTGRAWADEAVQPSTSIEKGGISP